MEKYLSKDSITIKNGCDYSNENAGCIPVYGMGGIIKYIDKYLYDGELVLLNKDDVNFDERECVVFGKGDKERIVYFDAWTKIHLQNHINSRKDSSSALFGSLKAPYNRMSIGGVEIRLRELGKRLNIPASA